MTIGAIGFYVESMEVNSEYERLIKCGAKSVHEPISRPYGLHEAVVADPEGNIIKLVCGI